MKKSFLEKKLEQIKRRRSLIKLVEARKLKKFSLILRTKNENKVLEKEDAETAELLMAFANHLDWKNVPDDDASDEEWDEYYEELLPKLDRFLKSVKNSISSKKELTDLIIESSSLISDVLKATSMDPFEVLKSFVEDTVVFYTKDYIINMLEDSLSNSIDDDEYDDMINPDNRLTKKLLKSQGYIELDSGDYLYIKP